jgi:hypothetical protein
MQSELSYPFEFVEAGEQVYAFRTDYDVNYAVRFKPSFYLLGTEAVFAEHVYELIISVVDKPEVTVPPDERIFYTVAEIVSDFFKRVENVAVYVCDDRDGRGDVRKRKFDGWYFYWRERNHLLMKHDRQFLEPDGFTYFASIILRDDNPLRKPIIDAFDDLADQYRFKNE